MFDGETLDGWKAMPRLPVPQYPGAPFKWRLEGEDLQESREETLHRLLSMYNSMSTGTPLPAWPGDKVCKFCNMAGVCRKQVWAEQLTE